MLMSILALQDSSHWYAAGWWDEQMNWEYQTLGVYGVNSVYDVYVSSQTFVAEYVAVVFPPQQGGQQDWIECGWIKGVSVVGDTQGKIMIYWGYKDETGYYSSFWKEVFEGESHWYKIYRGSNYWYVYSDGVLLKTVPLTYPGGLVQGASETSSDKNSMEGHFWNLKEKEPSGWWLWDSMYADADPPYWIQIINSHEFITGP